MKVVLAGPGAFGIKHLDGIRNIDAVAPPPPSAPSVDATKPEADSKPLTQPHLPIHVDVSHLDLRDIRLRMETPADSIRKGAQSYCATLNSASSLLN